MTTDERLNSQLESATRTVFGVLSTAKERSDPNLTLEALDRLIALIEFRAKLPSRNGGEGGGR